MVTQTLYEVISGVTSSSSSESYLPAVPRSFLETVRRAAWDKIDETGIIRDGPLSEALRNLSCSQKNTSNLGLKT
jgi:hypothetical protein